MTIKPIKTERDYQTSLKEIERLWDAKPNIANAEVQRSVAATCRLRNYEPPVICTPEELMGD